MKLARKLILALAACMTAILACTGWLWVRREAELIEGDARDDLAMIGRALRPALVRVWSTDGREAALAMLAYADQRMRRVEIRWVELGAGGAPIALDPVQRAALDRGEEVAAEAPERDRVLVYVPASIGGSLVGVLELSQKLGRERTFLRDSLRNVGLTIGVVVLVSAGLLLGLSAWLVGRPLRRLAAMARRVGEGDLACRLPVRGRDEIAEVAAEMNRMGDRLLEARARAAAEAAAKTAATEQLRHADRLATVGTLAAGLAHELGTPLAVVAGRGQLIAGGAVQGDAVAASARIVVDQAKRMANTIRQLLDFARRGSVARAPVELKVLARRTLSLLAPMAAKRGVTLRLEGQEEGVTAHVDAGQVEQVLANLLVNAIQAMPHGGAATVVVGRRTARDPLGPGPVAEHATLAVVDEGGGISREDLPRIFEPFFTTKGVGEGTGLGLSVVYGIVNDHGGWVEVESEVGRGTRFTVHLPLQGAAGCNLPSCGMHELVAPTGAPGG